MTFVPNHATAIIACDFFVVVKATFQLVYVCLLKTPSALEMLNSTRRRPK